MTFWIVVEWFWIVIECYFKRTNKPNLYTFKQVYLLQNSCFPFLTVVDLVFELWLTAFQKHTQSKLWHIPKEAFFQNSCFLFTTILKNMQKTGPQRVPPCRPLHLPVYIDMNICNKKTAFLAHLYVFLLFPFIFNCGWMVLNCDWVLFKSTNKAKLYKFKKIHFSKQLFSFQNQFKKCRKQVHKGYPLAGLACAVINWNEYLH